MDREPLLFYCIRAVKFNRNAVSAALVLIPPPPVTIIKQ